MFLPVHDSTPLRVIRLQYVTLALIAVNTLVFLATAAAVSEEALVDLASGVGIVPAEFTGGGGALDSLPEPLTLVTYQFLHAGWMHLIGNMLFLWVFADNIEDAWGHAGFLLFYLMCGAAGGLLHVAMQPASANPLIGASGAVSGVLAGYLLLFPRARVWILLFLRIPVRLPAWWVLGGWFALQVFSLFTGEDGDISVAWWAHIGGFLAGLAVTLMCRGWLTRRTAAG